MKENDLSLGHGLFGTSGTGDTSGFGGLVRTNANPGSTERPFGGYFDDLANNKTDTILFAGASLRKDGYEICINTRGERMPKCPAINENSVANNNSIADTSEKVYGMVVANGNLYDKIIDDYKITGSDDNYYIAVKNNLLGVFNNKFAVVIPFVHSFINSLAQFSEKPTIAISKSLCRRASFSRYKSIADPAAANQSNLKSHIIDKICHGASKIVLIIYFDADIFLFGKKP